MSEETIPLDEKMSSAVSLNPYGASAPVGYADNTSIVIGSSGVSNLEDMLHGLDSLFVAEDSDEDFLKPSETAGNEVRCLLEGASGYVDGNFPYGVVYPDGDGGLRIEWVEAECELRLITPALQEGRHYIYHENNDDFGNEYNVTPKTLGYWLNWLNRHAHASK